MVNYINRQFLTLISKAFNRSPCVAILGPRQCGKSTFAKHFLENRNAIYLDLQSPGDRNKLSDPELFFENFSDQIICLDEIQYVPELFPVLRSVIDRDRKPGRFLILGSATRDLIKQSKESLAGRISYIEMSPFMWNEVDGRFSLNQFLMKGGFPESLFLVDDLDSFDWKKDFISTFLERDIPNLGFTIPVPVMHNLWKMLAHYHGQVINYSKLGASLDLPAVQLKKYIYLLEQTYMIRLLQPYHSNLKKRMIKSPKVFIRDSGILHTLLNIQNFEALLGHPAVGSSWEGMVIENIIKRYHRWEPFFIRTSNGAEIDLLLKKANQMIFIECKFSKAPNSTHGFTSLQKEISPDKSFIIAPVEEGYDLSANTKIRNLTEILNELEE